MRSCKPLVVLGPNVAHVLLAIAPDGNGVVRNNVNPPSNDMAEVLAEIADGSAPERPEYVALNKISTAPGVLPVGPREAHSHW